MDQLKSDKAMAFQKENLSFMVDEYIRNKILRGLYKSGDRVLEYDIATELGISRGPVREGIRIAEQTGILTVEARKGAYITKFDENDIQEVFEIRILLENSILEYLIKNRSLTDGDFKALSNIIDSMVDIANSSADKAESILALNEKDIAFHQYIWNKSWNTRKKKTLYQYFFQLRLAMLHDTKATENLFKTATDHYEILRCLKENDLENCKQALIRHMVTY